MAEPTLTWESFNAENALPPGVEEVFTAVEGALATVKAVLQAIQAMFEVVKALTIDRLDILKATLETIRNDIAAIIETLEEAGVYYLSHVPQSLGTAKSPQTWMTEVATSFVDPGDPGRPDFEAAQDMGGVIIMGVAPDFNTLTNSVGALLEGLFRKFKLRDAELPLKENPNPPPRFILDKEALQGTYTENEFRGASKEPDWQPPTPLADLIPPLGQLAAILKKLLGLLVFGLGLSELIQQFIDFLQAKIDFLDGLTDEFTELLARFQQIAELGLGFHILFFEGNFTTAELVSAIQAAGLPEDVAAIETVVIEGLPYQVPDGKGGFTTVPGEDTTLQISPAQASVAGGIALLVAAGPGGEISNTIALLKGLTGAA